MEVIKIEYDKDNIISKKHTSEVCFKCSACSKYCPITLYVDKYNIEDSFIIHLFTSGDEEIWKHRAKDVWMCSACEKCVNVCPQDRDPTMVFNNLKQRSYQEGLAPENIYGLVDLLLKTGMAYPVTALVNKKRTSLGLSELKENSKTVQDLEAMAKAAGLKRKGE
jgi:heterodisulfide reductase subunit C